jgi:hypothetical protein
LENATVAPLRQLLQEVEELAGDLAEITDEQESSSAARGRLLGLCSAYPWDDRSKVGNRRQGDAAKESPTAAPSRPKP